MRTQRYCKRCDEWWSWPDPKYWAEIHPRRVIVRGNVWQCGTTWQCLTCRRGYFPARYAAMPEPERVAMRAKWAAMKRELRAR